MRLEFQPNKPLRVSLKYSRGVNERDRSGTPYVLYTLENSDYIILPPAVARNIEALAIRPGEVFEIEMRSEPGESRFSWSVSRLNLDQELNPPGEVLQPMRYRAILIDDGNTAQERATEIYSQSIEDVREWAAKILKNAASENAVVMVSLEKIGDRTVWTMFGHLYSIKNGFLVVKMAGGNESFGPAVSL